MKNNYDDEDQTDYSPNELAELSSRDPTRYRQIVNSNLEDGDTIEKWEQRNIEWAKQCLFEQRSHRG